MTHAMLGAIPERDVESIIDFMKLTRQRAQAEIDQLHAELQESWVNTYTAQYIKTATMGLVLAMVEDPDDPEPVPVHTIKVEGDRHVIPDGIPDFMFQAWKPYLVHREVDGPLAFMGVKGSAWTIREIPLYEPTNAFHRIVNAQLIHGETKFREATTLFNNIFENRDTLVRRYNAALMGESMFMLGEDDDGASSLLFD
jgi:hypothetical protein